MRRRQFLASLGLGAFGGVATSRVGSLRRRSRPVDDEIEDPRSGLLEILWSVDPTEPVATLSFDDGPDPEFTPRILDVLDRYGVKATFFSMGWNAARHPRLLREVVAAGHEVGTHTWSHLYLPRVTPSETRKQIEGGIRAVEKHARVPMRLFRPPHGRLSENAIRVAASLEQNVILWSVARGNLLWGRERVARHVIEALEPGGIVNLHDGIGRGTFQRGSEFADRLRRRRNAEVDALPQMIEGLHDKGLRLVTVSQLVAARRPGEREA